MRIHPLHSIEYLADYMRTTGHYPELHRHTARSTAQALDYIAEALRTPYKWVPVNDHHGTAEARANLLRTIQQMCEKLGLEHMYFKRPGYVAFGRPAE